MVGYRGNCWLRLPTCSRGLTSRSLSIAGCCALAVLAPCSSARIPIAAAKSLVDPQRPATDRQTALRHRVSRSWKLQLEQVVRAGCVRGAQEPATPTPLTPESGETYRAAWSGSANCYLTGQAADRRRLLRARALFDRAAAQGSAEAHLILGLINLDGSILKFDPVTANRHFLAAARMGNTSAMIQYGLSQANSRAGAQIACDWYERASQFANGRALRLLADCFAQGKGRPLDSARARKLYAQATALGDRTARLKMTRHRFSGTGARMAERQGCEWTLRAAARGNIRAMTAIASCLTSDDDTRK